MTASKKNTAKKATPKKQVAQQKDNLPVVTEMDDLLLADAGAGQENMTQDDLVIPRLSILQSLSPQVIKRGEEYIEGAEPSMIMDSVDNHMFDGEEGIVVVPCFYSRSIIEWKPRGEKGGGGFVGTHPYDAELLNSLPKNEKGHRVNIDGNIMADTMEYYVLVVDEDNGDYQPAVISMASTQLSLGKKWNMAMNRLKVDHPKGGKFNPAMFYMAYRLTTDPQSNDQGNWFGWSFAKEKPVLEIEDFGVDIYKAAREFHKMSSSGDVKVAEQEGEGSGVVAGEDTPM